MLVELMHWVKLPWIAEPRRISVDHPARAEDDGIFGYLILNTVEAHVDWLGTDVWQRSGHRWTPAKRFSHCCLNLFEITAVVERRKPLVADDFV